MEQPLENWNCQGKGSPKGQAEWTQRRPGDTSLVPQSLLPAPNNKEREEGFFLDLHHNRNFTNALASRQFLQCCDKNLREEAGCGMGEHPYVFPCRWQE